MGLTEKRPKDTSRGKGLDKNKFLDLAENFFFSSENRIRATVENLTENKGVCTAC